MTNHAVKYILKEMYRNRLERKRTNLELFIQNRDNQNQYREAVKDLEENELIRGDGMWFSLTDVGEERAELLANPSTQSIQIQNAINSPIQQGINSVQHQTATYQLPPISKIEEVISQIEKHLSDLSLTSKKERLVKAQVATIKAQIMDEPNQNIIKEAFGTIRNVIEGAAGSMLASGVWPSILTFLPDL